jgi:hypothetical protein
MVLTIHDEVLAPASTKYKLVSLPWSLGILSANDTLPSLATNPEAAVVDIAWSRVERKATYHAFSVKCSATLANTLLGVFIDSTYSLWPALLSLIVPSWFLYVFKFWGSRKVFERCRMYSVIILTTSPTGFPNDFGKLVIPVQRLVSSLYSPQHVQKVHVSGF